MIVEFQGQQHEFPDGTPQETIAKALAGIKQTTKTPAATDPNDPYAGQSVGEILAGTWPGKMVTGIRDLYTAAVEPLRAYVEGEQQTPEQTEAMIGRAAPAAALLAAPGAPPGTFAATRAVPKVVAPALETRPPEMLGVTLSEGQASRELPTIQREQAALGGRAGPPAAKSAQEFIDQQKAQLIEARDKIAREFDPYGARIAETPAEAGEVVQEGMQRTAAMRKADVKARYDLAKDYGGEIHAAAFEGMPQKIKGDLTLREDAIIVDDQTPFSNRMLGEIEKNVGNLRIPNRADPFGQPGQDNIVGVSLKGVEQWRKRLSAMRRDAYDKGTDTDKRAAKAILDAFDERIDAAVNGGLFNGDQRAVKAWNDARAAYKDYAGEFKAKPGDPVGRVVEKIIGSDRGGPSTPEKVIDDIIGSQGVRPSDLNVKVTRRIKGILGERSPEWSAVKQGLFSRLVETPEGKTEFGPGTVANRIADFLSNKSMADLVYTQPEQTLLRQYADLMRHIEVPRAGANWSNTAAFGAESYRPSLTSRVLDRIGSGIGPWVAAALGHFVIPGLPFGAAEAAGAGAAKLARFTAQQREARQIQKMMPVLSNVTRDFKKAGERAEKTPNPRNMALLTLAARNLATNLREAGLPQLADGVLREIQGPASAPAAPEGTKGDKGQ